MRYAILLIKLVTSSFQANSNIEQHGPQGRGRVSNNMKLVAADQPGSSIGGGKGKIKIIWAWPTPLPLKKKKKT